MKSNTTASYILKIPKNLDSTRSEAEEALQKIEKKFIYEQGLSAGYSLHPQDAYKTLGSRRTTLGDDGNYSLQVNQGSGSPCSQYAQIVDTMEQWRNEKRSPESAIENLLRIMTENYRDVIDPPKKSVQKYGRDHEGNKVYQIVKNSTLIVPYKLSYGPEDRLPFRDRLSDYSAMVVDGDTAASMLSKSSQKSGLNGYIEHPEQSRVLCLPRPSDVYTTIMDTLNQAGLLEKKERKQVVQDQRASTSGRRQAPRDTGAQPSQKPRGVQSASAESSLAPAVVGLNQAPAVGIPVMQPIQPQIASPFAGFNEMREALPPAPAVTQSLFTDREAERSSLGFAVAPPQEATRASKSSFKDRIKNKLRQGIEKL